MPEKIEVPVIEQYCTLYLPMLQESKKARERQGKMKVKVMPDIWCLLLGTYTMKKSSFGLGCVLKKVIEYSENTFQWVGNFPS